MKKKFVLRGLLIYYLLMKRIRTKEHDADAVTVILTVWKRDYLEEQLLALLRQTVCPYQIWIQQSLHYVDISRIVKKYCDKVYYFCWEENPGVFGRFESVMQVKTPYVCILDDDVIPGDRYMENALKACKRLNAIISPHGRLLSPDTYRTELFVGDGYEFQHSFCLNDTEVDFGNNAWFFKREWISYFLLEAPLYRNNGEDIHLSAMCRVFGGIPTYVCRQIVPVESGSVKRTYSMDQYALHQMPMFSKERIEVISRFRKLGWPLLLEKKHINLYKESSYPLSVVMVVVGAGVKAAIQSILKQTWSDFELILVCPGRKNFYGNWKDERLHWIEVGGMYSKYTLLNIGCSVAKGKYICLMESGYISHPERLRLQFEFMEDNKDVVAAGKALDNKKIFLPTIIVRREVLHKIKYYDELLDGLAEENLCCRLLQEGLIVLFDNN